MRRVLLLVCLAGLMAGCEEALGPPDAAAPTSDAGAIDAGKPEEDLGVDNRLSAQGQLRPAVEEAAGARHVLRGRLGAHGVSTSSNARHRLRGGFVPLQR